MAAASSFAPFSPILLYPIFSCCILQRIIYTEIKCGQCAIHFYGCSKFLCTILSNIVVPYIFMLYSAANNIYRDQVWSTCYSFLWLQQVPLHHSLQSCCSLYFHIVFCSE